MASSLVQRVVILFGGRFPGEKAAGLFVDLNARSLAEEGAQVTVLAPRRFGRLPLSAVPYQVRYLPTIDLSRVPFVWGAANFISVLVFSKWAYLWLLFKSAADDLVISNDAWPLLVATFVRKNTMFEVHDFVKDTWMYRALLRRVKIILVTNEWKRNELISRFAVPLERLTLERNAVDTREFGTVGKSEARMELGIDAASAVAVYTGHLYEWKGADTLAAAARLTPDVQFYFVGGSAEDVEKFKTAHRETPNIRAVGYQPHERMPLWQSAADVLVLPNSGKEEISVHYTSPMKLFEYMASGRPIVAADLPSIREVLAENGHYAVPDDAASFATAIRAALSDDGTRVARARAWVESHSWHARAKRILQRII